MYRSIEDYSINEINDLYQSIVKRINDGDEKLFEIFYERGISSLSDELIYEYVLNELNIEATPDNLNEINQQLYYFNGFSSVYYTDTKYIEYIKKQNYIKVFKDKDVNLVINELLDKLMQFDENNIDEYFELIFKEFVFDEYDFNVIYEAFLLKALNLNIENKKALDYIIVNSPELSEKLYDELREAYNKYLTNVIENDKEKLNTLIKKISPDKLCNSITNPVKIQCLNIKDVKEYIDNGQETIALYIEDDLFIQLETNYIIKLLNNSNFLNILNNNVEIYNNKLKHIVNNINIIELFQYLVKNNNDQVINYILDNIEMTDELFDIVFKYNQSILVYNDLYNNTVRKCFTNNSHFFKKLLDNNYYSFLPYIKEEELTDELIEIMNGYIPEIIKTASFPILKSEKIYRLFFNSCTTGDDYFKIFFEMFSKGYLTNERRVEFLLNAEPDPYYVDYHKIDTNISVDEVKAAIEHGYEYTDNTLVRTVEQAMVFIENNHPEAVEKIKNKLTLDTLMLALKNGYRPKSFEMKEKIKDIFLDNSFLEIDKISNSEYKEIFLLYALTDEYFFNLVYGSSSHFKLEELLNNPNLSDIVKQYLIFKRDFSNNIDYCLDINTEEDIVKYFNEEGPKKVLYDVALFDKRLFNKVFSSEDYKSKTNYSKNIEEYIEFSRRYGLIFNDLIQNLSDIDYYFTENGPKEILYEKGLFDKKIFETIFGNDDWKEYYKPSPSILNYIDFKKKYGLLLNNIIQNIDDINKYFDGNGFSSEFYEEKINIILFDAELFKLAFSSEDYKNKAKYPKNIEEYIEFSRRCGYIFNLLIKDFNDINKYFDENGIKKELYDEALFNPDHFKILFLNDRYKNICNYPENVERYIEFCRKYGLIFNNTIQNVDDINKYFDENGIKKELYDEALFKSNLFEFLFKHDNDKNYKNICNYPENVERYIEFVKHNGFILSLIINTTEDIGKYFDENGIKKELYDLALFDVNIFSILFNDDTYKSICNYPEYIETYITFRKKEKFECGLEINSTEDIEKYFDKDGFNNDGIHQIIYSSNLYRELDDEFFEDYYNKNYSISSLNKLLDLLDKRYAYLIRFVHDTIDLELPLKETDNEIIKDYYNLDLIDYDIFSDIIKYTYYSDDESTAEISSIIKHKKLIVLLKFYFMLYDEFDIKIFKTAVINFNNNEELFNNISSVNDLTEEEIAKIYMLLINGDKSAAGVIKKREDLKKYDEIVYNENNKIINGEDLNALKVLVFKMLFNIDSKLLEKILKKYGDGSCLQSLMNSIENEELKEIVMEYDYIIKFMISINNSSDLDSLRVLARRVNDNYKNNNIEKLKNIWNNFSRLDSDLMSILGEEINEKITNYDELLNTPESEIPVLDNEPLFKVTDVPLTEDFEYDNKKMEKGIKVKMIELNGLPFVSLGHVLNAYGNDGKLSDFNHPRVIGKTHICLTAIDDNIYSLVLKEDSDIDHIQILFSELPIKSISIASEQDAGSGTKNNSHDINSYFVGKYNPIRTTISETSGGYNEYVYYRKGLMPSAVLIRGDIPTKSEIQAAAYLSRIMGRDIPLVKINKEKYPVRSREEMKERDKKLQETFYKELYAKRNSKRNRKRIEDLKSARDMLVGLMSDMTPETSYDDEFEKEGRAI